MHYVIPPWRCGLVLLLLAAFMLPPEALAQDTKRDSLRWAAMKWAKENNAEIQDFPDSLRICVTDNADGGGGVSVTPGDREREGGDGRPEGSGGSWVTTTEVPWALDDGQMVFIWEGLRGNDDRPRPFATVDIELDENPNSQDKTPMDWGLGVNFLGYDYTSLIVVVLKDDEFVEGGPIDLPPDDGGDIIPIPIPIPDPPTVAWIDRPDRPTDMPCDKHEIVFSDGNGGWIMFDIDEWPQFGPEMQRAMQRNVAYIAEFGEDVPIYIRGATEPVIGNRIIVIPVGLQQALPETVTTTQVWPVGLPEATLMDAGLLQFGIEHRAIGNPLMSIDDGNLLLTNLDGPEVAGIRTTVGPSTQGLIINLSLGVLVGDEVQVEFIGETEKNVNAAETVFLQLGIQRRGNRTLFSADAGTNEWSTMTVQMERNGKLTRPRTVANGGSFGLRRVKVVGMGLATQAEQGFDGFFINVERNGRVGTVRLIPDGVNMEAFKLDNVALRFPDARPGSDVSLNYETIERVQDASPFSGPLLKAEAALTHLATPRVIEQPELLGNYPEPFNPTTSIRYALPEQAQVRLEVFDITGRRVAVLVDGFQSAGTHTARFDASGLASGVYLSRLVTPNAVLSKTMLLMK